MTKHRLRAYFGRGYHQKVADLLGINVRTVEYWRTIVPRGWAYELEVKTAGALRVDPSFYPRYVSPADSGRRRPKRKVTL